MRLVGMLDSPYVRRVAISLQLLGIEFEHASISVFRGFDAFAAINPVVKAPTLVCDDGTVLMESSLILDYAEALAAGRRSLLPAAPVARSHALRRIGLALIACEKSVSIVYERALRPLEKRHPPWVERVTAQMLTALDGLEAELARSAPSIDSESIGQDGVSSAVAWQFIRQTLADTLPTARYPALAACSERAETLPEFRAAPHGDSVYRAAR